MEYKKLVEVHRPSKTIAFGELSTCEQVRHNLQPSTM